MVFAAQLMREIRGSGVNTRHKRQERDSASMPHLPFQLAITIVRNPYKDHHFLQPISVMAIYNPVLDKCKKIYTLCGQLYS